MPTDMMIRRLRVNSIVAEEDASALRALPISVQRVREGHAIVREGDHPTRCVVIMSGFAVRSKVNEAGKRQILSFHPAGDMPDLYGLLIDRMDHDLVTLSACQLGFVEHRHIHELIDKRPALGKALWRETLVDASIFREWIVNLGTRQAAGRLAHLLTELRQRLDAVGLVADDQFEFPITQMELAEALGISPVHVNRVLQAFRGADLIEIGQDKVRLKDLESLLKLGGFNEEYLHQL